MGAGPKPKPYTLNPESKILDCARPLHVLGAGPANRASLVSQNWGGLLQGGMYGVIKGYITAFRVPFLGPRNKGYSRFGCILGFPCFGKLPSL